jgi:YfiH family protein
VSDFSAEAFASSEASAVPALTDALMARHGIAHGFGCRGSGFPAGCIFPRQVHGVAVAQVESGQAVPLEADAIVSPPSGPYVGVVTADCVPILAASEDGTYVAAIHAGWRGFAAGVIEAGLDALARAARGRPLIAAIGPAARGCCYEVDAPVRDALAERYATELAGHLEPGRPGHWQLDLPGLAGAVLQRDGKWQIRQVGVDHRVCTICSGERFESYRREGAAAGRLRHFIGPKAPIPAQT